jgi:hypothetical protein
MLREDLVLLLLRAGADANIRGRDQRSLVRSVCGVCVRVIVVA